MHRTIVATRIKGWSQKKRRKVPTNERSIPFLDPFRCPLDLPRFVTRCTAIAFSLLARLADLSPSPPRNLFPDSQRAAITQLRASPLFLLALSAATHHSYTFLSSPLDRRPSFSFPCVPFITRRPCPTPTLTPGLFREHHLHNPPALPSRAACTFHRPYYFHR